MEQLVCLRRLPPWRLPGGHRHRRGPRLRGARRRDAHGLDELAAGGALGSQSHVLPDATEGGGTGGW